MRSPVFNHPSPYSMIQCYSTTLLYLVEGPIPTPKTMSWRVAANVGDIAKDGRYICWRSGKLAAQNVNFADFEIRMQFWDDILLVVYRQTMNTIFRMPIYPILKKRNANLMNTNAGLWLVASNVDSYEYWWAEKFVLGQVTPSDLNIVNPNALCPLDHACTLDHFRVTTHTLFQSPGGSCYSRQVAHVTSVATNTLDRWHRNMVVYFLAT